LPHRLCVDGIPRLGVRQENSKCIPAVHGVDCVRGTYSSSKGNEPVCRNATDGKRKPREAFASHARFRCG